MTPVLRGQEGSLMGCMQWQGLRAEMSRGHRTSLCLPVNHSIRSQEARKTPRSDPLDHT